ncbi:MAG: histidine phosphatase family protein [Ruminococcus sp.]|nr:histidine phosphatase family protein [Ruminococcus sp.]
MLYIMRHGQTEWNAKHKLQGRTDIPLSDKGRTMARSAGNEYRNIHFDVCYCSPLVRAKETAEILLKDRNIPVITDDRLVEMSFGVYEGKENCFQLKESNIYTLFKQPEKYIVPVENGESFDELYSRTGEFIREVVEPQLKEHKDILIVGHGAMNNSIICQINNILLEKFWSTGIENCKLIKLK